MKRLLTISLAFYSFVLFGQMPKKWDHRDSIVSKYHVDRMLPVINDSALFQLDEEIRGWTYSTDKQWLTSENKIPLMGISTEKHTTSSSEAEIGTDNMKSLYIHQMTQGEDTFYVYSRYFEEGHYKRPLTQKGWEVEKSLYYAVIRKPKKTPELATLQLDTNYYFPFTIYSEGIIKNVKPKKDPIKYIEGNIFVEPSIRNLVFQMERKSNGQLRFLIYSIHPVFDDPSGVVQDVKILNKSIYGVKETLHRIHYTVLEEEWPKTLLP